MISTEHYESFIMPFDSAWSLRRRPFGIHYCGSDPHRFADVFAKLPHLDFLDVGWGGDLAVLREKLPGTFLNIRLSPVEIVHQSVEEIRRAIESARRGLGADPLSHRRLLHQHGRPGHGRQGPGHLRDGLRAARGKLPAPGI